MKTLKITINQVEFNLTDEQVESLKNQLLVKEITDRPLPTTWEQCNDIVKPAWFISSFNENVIKDEIGGGKNYTPSQKHGKSILASCQLMVISEALSKVFEYDGKWEVCYDDNEEVIFNTYLLSHPSSTQIIFNSKEAAEHSIKYFEQLWRDYFMLD